MADSLPTTTKQWSVNGTNGPSSLVLSEQPLPKLGDTQVLVKFHAAALNPRDILITRGKFPFTLKPGVVLGSDGAGTVLSVGKHTTRFQPGDKVITLLHQGHLSGCITPAITETGLGGSLDGSLRSYGVFDEQGLVSKPECLTFEEAATLSCAGVTAWNGLFGLAGRPLMAGQWLLTQGTGGVSTFAVQFAHAVGARVIATTSSDDKIPFLQKLGAEHVINYRTDPAWGETAKALTGGVGVDMVLDIAGPPTLAQSAKAVKLDGIVVCAGFVGGEGKGQDLLDAWMSLYTARGIWCGSRVQMEEMCRAIGARPEALRPIVDLKKFSLDELKEAMQFLDSGKNLGKVCISIA